MSKNITISLEDAVKDTLDRHMEYLKTISPVGVRVSSSNYVNEVLRKALVASGCIIVANPREEPVSYTSDMATPLLDRVVPVGEGSSPLAVTVVKSTPTPDWMFEHGE